MGWRKSWPGHAIAAGVLCVGFALAHAEQNTARDSVAQAILAYENNDYREANQAFKKLAESGQVEAQRYLGQMYDKGLGVPQNYQKAVSWYERAAKQKDPAAQYHLGLKYANGHGVKEDQFRAYIWFAISFNNGFELAADPLRVLNKSLSTRERQKALQVVVKEMEQYGK
ncbi:tetratricopeptide repeat protein [Kaarinaea lacus]